MERDELLTKLAMELAEWPQDLPGPNIPGLWACRHASWRCHAIGYYEPIFEHDWLLRREELINKPSWDDAPDAANVRCQDADGYWHFGDCPDSGCPYPTPRGTWESGPNGKWLTGVSRRGGAIPAGYDWRFTLERQMVFTPEVPPRHVDLRFSIDVPDESDPAPYPVAADFLRAGLKHMEDRASTYDKPAGERSMAATVSAFAAITGIEMTEEQGWLFMGVLKDVRSQQGDYRADNYEDRAAYAGLQGEAAAKERTR